MKNLKRALCMSLAIVMILGMMVVGTSAANFTDTDEIVNTEAVNTMNALNIINGKGDGSYFDPKGIVTRGEMAKMICVALNGGRDPQLGTTAYSFTDTTGHWAAGYIEYCYNLNIVAGRGEGIFDPNGTVTGTEAAKMLLVAIGYDSANEGFTGASWATAVDVRANQKEFYEDLETMNPAKGLTRDNAAQMVYNAINAVKVEYDYKLTTVNGALVTVAVVKDVTTGNLTILADKFGANTDKGYLNIVSYNKDTKKYTYTVTDNLFAAATPATGFTKTFSTTQDLTGLYGKYVKVITKTTTSGTSLYGMYDISENIVNTTVGGLGTFNTDNFKADGTKYYAETTTAAVRVHVYGYNGNAVNTYALNAITADKSCRVVLVSNDDNTRINYAVLFPTAVSKVTYVGADTLTTAAGAFDFDDDVIEAGLAKNNYVQITTAATSFDNKNHVSKISTVSGSVDGLDGSNKVLVGGEWYAPTGSATVGLTVGESYDLYVVGGYYYAEKKTSSTSTSDIVYVSAVNAATALGSQEVKAYFSDGTNSIITVSKCSLAGTAADLLTVSTNNVVAGLYTFKISNGTYHLTAIDGTNNKAGFTNYYAGATTGFFKAVSGTNAAYIDTTGADSYIADDALVFVDNTTGGVRTIKVITGADLKSWNSNYADTTPVVLTKAVSGLNTAKVVLLTGVAGIPTAGSTTYGYITSTPYSMKDGDNTYITYTMWNGTESLTVIDKASGATPANRTKGSFISYTVSSGNYIESTALAAVKVAVVGYDGINISMVNGATGAAEATNLIDKDTKFMYIKSANVAGVAGGEVAIASQNSYGAYLANAYYYTAAGAVDLLVYDIDNKISSTTAAGVSITVPATTTVAGLTGSTVTWTLNGVVVTAGTYIAQPGTNLVATVTQSSTVLTPTAADDVLSGGTGATAAVVTVPTMGGTTPSATAGGVSVTFDCATGDETYASGVYSFTWAVNNNATNAYTITLA